MGISLFHALILFSLSFLSVQHLEASQGASLSLGPGPSHSSVPVEISKKHSRKPIQHLLPLHQTLLWSWMGPEIEVDSTGHRTLRGKGGIPFLGAVLGGSARGEG